MRWSLWIVVCGAAPGVIAMARPTVQVEHRFTAPHSLAAIEMQKVHNIEIASAHTYQLSKRALLSHNISSLFELPLDLPQEGSSQHIDFYVPLRKGEKAQLVGTIKRFSRDFWILNIDAVIGDHKNELDYRAVAEGFRTSLRKRIERAPDSGHLFVLVPDFQNSRRTGWVVRPYEIFDVDAERNSLFAAAVSTPTSKPLNVWNVFWKGSRLAYGETTEIKLPFASVGVIPAKVTRIEPTRWVVSLDQPRFETPNAGYRDGVMAGLIKELQELAAESEDKGRPVYITMPHWSDARRGFAITNEATIETQPTALGFEPWVKVEPNRETFAFEGASRSAPRASPLTFVVPVGNSRYWIAHGNAYVSRPPIMKGNDVIRPAIVRILFATHSMTHRGPAGQSELRLTDPMELPSVLNALKSKSPVSSREFDVVMRVPISEHRHFLLRERKETRTIPIALTETDPSLWEDHPSERKVLKSLKPGFGVNRLALKRRTIKGGERSNDEVDSSSAAGPDESSVTEEVHPKVH